MSQMDSPYSHTSSKEGIANERKNRVAGLHLFWQLDTVYDNDEDECHIIYIYISIYRRGGFQKYYTQWFIIPRYT